MITLASTLALLAWPVNATMEATDGSTVKLASFRGKPVVLFYEDKDSTKLNIALKDALIVEARKRDMLQAAHVVAVANLSGFNWFPAKELAVAGVKKAEREFGVPVYVDFRGDLSSGQMRLSDKSSTVVLLDRHGRVVWQRTGALSEAEVSGVIGRLVELSREP